MDDTTAVAALSYSMWRRTMVGHWPPSTTTRNAPSVAHFRVGWMMVVISFCWKSWSTALTDEIVCWGFGPTVPTAYYYSIILRAVAATCNSLLLQEFQGQKEGELHTSHPTGQRFPKMITSNTWRRVRENIRNIRIRKKLPSADTAVRPRKHVFTPFPHLPPDFIVNATHDTLDEKQHMKMMFDSEQWHNCMGYDTIWYCDTMWQYDTKNVKNPKQ